MIGLITVYWMCFSFNQQQLKYAQFEECVQLLKEV